MSGTSQKQSSEQFNINWEMRLDMMKNQLEIGNPFPTEDFFYDSVWHIWKERIENGQNREEKQIQEIYKKWKRQEDQFNDRSFDPDGWASDDYWQSCQVTNTMHAALLVSIWSEIENFLKSILAICSETDGNKGVIKIPYRFKEIKEALEKLGIKIMECDAALIANAVRILNNSFKHDDGQYRPDNEKPHTQIDQNLLSNWEVLKDLNDNEIDCSKLPIQEILKDCNSFCMDLLKKTEAALKKKHAKDV